MRSRFLQPFVAFTRPAHFAVAALLLAGPAVEGRAQAVRVRANFPATNAPVRALAIDSARRIAYIGGDFTIVGGQDRLRLAAIHLDTGAVLPWNPLPNGTVETIAIDGDRIYIGGRFGSVNGNPRSRIAALDLAGNVVPTWNAAVRTAGFPLDPSLDEARVTSIAITPSNIFVAGTFTEVQSISTGQDATRRNRLAAFTKDNASVRNWNPNPNGEIHALRTSGTTLHVIGTFSSITGGDGVVRARRSYARFNNNVAVQPVSLLPTANAGADPAAFTAIALRGDTTILAGPFSRIGAEARTGLAIIDDTGSLLPFRATPGLSLVTAITANNTTIFTADDGRFVNGQLRFLRAYDNAGTLLPWLPVVANNSGFEDPVTFRANPPEFLALALDGPWLYVAGSFTVISGVYQPGFAALSLPVTTPPPTLSARGRTSIKTTRKKLTLKGTSTNSTLIQYKAGKGGFKNARGTAAAWKFPVRLGTKKRTIAKVRATGPGGTSKLLKFTITRK